MFSPSFTRTSRLLVGTLAFSFRLIKPFVILHAVKSNIFGFV
jgi:hypothetical protein